MVAILITQAHFALSIIEQSEAHLVVGLDGQPLDAHDAPLASPRRLPSAVAVTGLTMPAFTSGRRNHSKTCPVRSEQPPGPGEQMHPDAYPDEFRDLVDGHKCAI